MERILFALCVVFGVSMFAVEGNAAPGSFCSIGNQDQMGGVWIGVDDQHRDTDDWIVVTDSNKIYVNFKGTEATYVCKGENKYGSAYLLTTIDGSEYLCVYKAHIFDSIVQYSLSTLSGGFGSRSIPAGSSHNFNHLCGKGQQQHALDIRRSYEHQL